MPSWISGARLSSKPSPKRLLLSPTIFSIRFERIPSGCEQSCSTRSTTSLQLWRRASMRSGRRRRCVSVRARARRRDQRAAQPAAAWPRDQLILLDRRKCPYGVDQAGGLRECLVDVPFCPDSGRSADILGLRIRARERTSSINNPGYHLASTRKWTFDSRFVVVGGASSEAHLAETSRNTLARVTARRLHDILRHIPGDLASHVPADLSNGNQTRCAPRRSD